MEIFDKEELHNDCTVQIWENTETGAVSVGWWENGNEEDRAKLVDSLRLVILNIRNGTVGESDIEALYDALEFVDSRRVHGESKS